MPNIARKVHRLQTVATGAQATTDENIVDTAVDLYIYALKYLTFLADADRDVQPKVLPCPYRREHVGPSDRTSEAQRILSLAEARALV
jgi:hypothetical protein